MFQDIRLTRRGQIVFGVIAAVLSALLAWLVFSLAQQMAQASSGPDLNYTQTTSIYTQVQVESGDTLWAIAAAHGTSSDVRQDVREIAQLNNLADPTVRVGQTLVIPVARPAGS